VQKKNPKQVSRVV